MHTNLTSYSGLVYILRFSRALGNEKHQARYYIGYCELGRLAERLQEHEKGAGAAITRAAVQAGIALELVASFPGSRRLERRLKRQKNARRIVERFEKGTLRL